MQNQSKYKVLRGVGATLLAVLLLALSFGLGVMFGSPIKNWLADTFGAKDKGGVDFSELTYAALGDSITMGGVGGAVAEEPYCVCVGNILNLKSVKNYGMSGSTLCSKTSSYTHGYQPMCERYSEMGEADIVSLMGGTNDFTQGVIGTIDDTVTDTIYGALNALAKGLKEKYPNAFIFFMTPLESVWGTVSKRAQICQAYKDVGAKYDIPVLDTNSLCDFSLEYNSVGYSGDGVHPSQEFYKTVLAPVVADFIRENYKPAAEAA